MRRGWIKYLNIFLCVIVVYLSFNIFLFLRSYGKEKAEAAVLPISPESQSLAKSEKNLSDYAVIYKRNLFNISEISKPITTSSKVSSFKLKGTVVGSSEFTFCIIEDKSKRKDGLYQKGDKIQDMEVNEIMVDSVVLVRGAEKIVLYINENGEETKTNDRTVVTAGLPSPDFPSLENPSPNKWILSREDILQATKNVSQIMSGLKIKPNFSAGKMEGFRIDDIDEGSIALEMGIKKGDVVKKINGETIDSPKKIFEFYRNLERSNSIQLDVDRGDSTETLTYEIK
ncbi:hypothetical protein KAS42_05160 [bacterium]|nr:hypothetical protein [bacterium]